MRDSKFCLLQELYNYYLVAFIKFVEQFEVSNRTSFNGLVEQKIFTCKF